MVFSSQLFLFWFLPAALALYYAAPARARLLVLTLVSYVFYGWANPRFVLVMLFTTVVDYAAGRAIGDPRWARRPGVRRGLVTASIVANLSVLGFFKYFNLGVETWNAIAAALPGGAAWRWEDALRVTLPLGISFYTFQSMSYTIDVYRGKVKPLMSLIDFACYVSMFPQLVAGPIVRFSDVAAQMRERTHTFVKFARGVACFGIGLGKKVLLANPLGEVADACFTAHAPGTFEAWWGLLAYSFQIYFDFSGYSDMAIGLGLMFGFVFIQNFDSPYRSQSITEFWRRWHMSLSTWLRDYLYIPLGGNKLGAVRTYVNLMLVMLLGGLWHGAAWNFVAWGGWHGLLLVVERRLGKRPVWAAAPAALRTAVTFLLVLAGWVLFRAESFRHAARYFGALAGLGGPESPLLPGLVLTPLAAGAMAAAVVVTWGGPRTWEWTAALPAWKAVAVVGVLLAAMAMLTVQAHNPFIYFIF